MAANSWDQFNSQLHNQDIPTPTPPQPGPVKTVLGAVGNAINPFSSTNIVQQAGGAYNDFFSNLQDHLVSIGQNIFQGGVNDLSNAFQPQIQNADPNSQQYAPSKSMTQMQNGTDPLASDPRMQQFNSQMNSNQQLGGFGAGMNTEANAVNQGIVQPASKIISPVIDLLNKFSKGAADVATGQALGTTEAKGNQLSAQAEQDYQQWKSQNPKMANALEFLSSNLQGGLTIGGATEGIEGLKNANERVSAQTKTLPPPDGGINELQAKPVEPVNSLTEAQTAREQAATEGVKSLQNMGQKVGEFKSGLGKEFEEGAKNIEKSKPSIRVNLSNQQMEALQALKESKSFALPDYIEKNNSNVSVGGKALDLGTMNPKVAAQIQKEMGTMQGQTAVSLTPTQAQDLITQLNKGTFTAKASGQLAVNQQMIEITNSVKQAAKEAFGSEWEKVYSQYAKGVTAVEKLNDIVNLDKAATPTDINKSLTSLLKLGQTPEGKIILRNAVEEFKAHSGIDLSDPVKAVHQIIDKQIALEDAQAADKQATKEAKAKAEKGGFLKQVTKGATNPQYLGKRLVEGGAIAIFAYPLFRKLSKLIYGN